MRQEADRNKIFNKCKNIIDRIVSETRAKDATYVMIRLSTIAHEIDKLRQSLYNYNFYEYFSNQYLSVTYSKGDGGITVEIKKWVRERKEERYKSANNE